MDEADWKALVQVNNSPGSHRLLAILKARREACRDSLEQCRDRDEVVRLQGKAASLSELIENLNQARDVVAKRYS